MNPDVWLPVGGIVMRSSSDSPTNPPSAKNDTVPGGTFPADIILYDLNTQQEINLSQLAGGDGEAKAGDGVPGYLVPARRGVGVAVGRAIGDEPKRSCTTPRTIRIDDARANACLSERVSARRTIAVSPSCAIVTPSF